MTDIQQDLLTDILLEPKTASIGGRIGGVIVDCLILWGVDFGIGDLVAGTRVVYK
jgi:hypothetical protein